MASTSIWPVIRISPLRVTIDTPIEWAFELGRYLRLVRGRCPSVDLGYPPRHCHSGAPAALTAFTRNVERVEMIAVAAVSAVDSNVIGDKRS